jgi:16S rRNA (uracil1498-N3)-methyltransferase
VSKRFGNVNLILFEPAEAAAPLPRTDPRAGHLLDVLRRRPGDTFDAGLVNGPRGKGTLVRLGEQALELSFAWGAQPVPLEPLTLLLGLPRPQTARKILQEAAALGVARMDFFLSEKGEGGYARSTLWSSGEWRRHLLAGAAQAFDTRLPEVEAGLILAAAVERLPAAGRRLALDNYEAAQELGPEAICPNVGGVPSPRGIEPGGEVTPGDNFVPAVTLALGPERGWSTAERNLLRAQGFTLVHLGSRVLRLETAVVAAVALVRSARGWLR